MSNPNPASDAGGIFPGMGEAPSDPDWNAPYDEKDPIDGKGMTPDDAAASAYDDHDRHHNGIAESEREGFGKFLKQHADAVGTNVIDGVNSLLQPAITLRHGTQEEKRALLGHVVQEYDIRDVPMANEGSAPLTEDQSLAVVEDFMAARPDAQDPEVQERMGYHLQQMQAQGHPLDLEVAYQHSVYGGQVQRHRGSSRGSSSEPKRPSISPKRGLGPAKCQAAAPCRRMRWTTPSRAFSTNWHRAVIGRRST